MAQRQTTTAIGVHEAAEILGRTINAIYIAVRQGRLPARKWGRRLIFLRHELEQFLHQLPAAERRGLDHSITDDAAEL